MSAQSEVDRFVDFYARRCTETGFRPDQTTSHDQQMRFLQDCLKRFCSSLLCMKRADPTRPISNEAIVFVGPGVEYRLFIDFIIGAGGATPSLTKKLTGYLPTAQPLVNPLTLEQLPEGWLAPTIPGCTGPTPEPIPEPIPEPPALKSRDQFYSELRAIDAFYAAPEGLQRSNPRGMALVDGNGIPYADVEALGAWGYDLMLGATVEECKTRIRQSEEWRAKHPGEVPF